METIDEEPRAREHYHQPPRQPLLMLYQEMLMWKRLDDRTAIHYRCLMNQATRKFSVQSADFCRLPMNTEQIRQRQIQFVELLCECDPSERSGAFDSIEEAIADHERRFGTDGPSDSV